MGTVEKMVENRGTILGVISIPIFQTLSRIYDLILSTR